MIYKDIIRLLSQLKTLYCYMILSFWIFCMVAGMYKYVGKDYIPSTVNVKNHPYWRVQTKSNDCNSPDNIKLGDEGGLLNDEWSIQGVILLTRHGDRGPLSHIRGIGHVNCGYDTDTSLLTKYRFTVQNITNTSSSSATWNKQGPFHGFPLLPPTDNSCFLGQLTFKGVAQMLKVGGIIRDAYMQELGLNQKTTIRVTNNSESAMYDSDEILVFSTRYRRTFQSAMALMYTFLDQDDRWNFLQLHESQSYTFCFEDCACERADQLKRKIDKYHRTSLKQYQYINSIVQEVANTLFENPAENLDLMEARDAVLALICHEVPKPCQTKNDPYEQTPIPSDETLNDLINIDDVSNTNQVEDNDQIIPSDKEPMIGCLSQDQIDSVMTFSRWQGIKNAANVENQYMEKLRAYGLCRKIMSYILKMISGDKLKLVLFSGHDRTIHNLGSAFGLYFDTPFIPYASRLSFEVYKSNKNDQFYFRFVFNGVDMTNQINFCEGDKSLRVSRRNRKSKADLCPIENFIRFIHDDYFQNVTNFKDACYIKNNEPITSF